MGWWTCASRSLAPWVLWTSSATPPRSLGKAGRILVQDGGVTGLALEEGGTYGCGALVITTGTFLNGLIHVGREQHQIFLEPEGPDVDEIYVNGFSMSLPREVQVDLVHSLPVWKTRLFSGLGTLLNTISSSLRR